MNLLPTFSFLRNTYSASMNSNKNYYACLTGLRGFTCKNSDTSMGNDLSNGKRSEPVDIHAMKLWAEANLSACARAAVNIIDRAVTGDKKAADVVEELFLLSREENREELLALGKIVDRYKNCNHDSHT